MDSCLLLTTVMNSVQNNVGLSQLHELLGCRVAVVDEAVGTGAHNMQRDLDLAQHATDTGTAVLRLYSWQPFAVSLGHSQNIDSIDVKACEERGFDVVRRPTGGRAVLHADEITYCLACVLPPDVSQHDVYREVHVDLLRAMKTLGATNASFAKQQTDFREHYKKVESSACFSASARWELEWQGKKLVGSAQRMFGRTLLQHGSIPLNPGFERIAEVTSSQPDRVKEVLRKKAATVSEACGRTIGYSAARDAIVAAISGSCG